MATDQVSETQLHGKDDMEGDAHASEATKWTELTGAL